MSILGNDPDNPLSGNTPPDTLADNSPTGLTDQGDSIADDSDVAARALADEDPETGVADPAPAVEPDPPVEASPPVEAFAPVEAVNDIGGVGETRAIDPDYDE